MHFGNQTDSTPAEAFNEVHLPWRLLRVERPTHHFGCEITELCFASRCGQRCPVKVIGEIEFRIINPSRMVQTQRYFHQPASERRQSWNSLRQEVSDCIE